jgi:hypothetical protein
MKKEDNKEWGMESVKIKVSVLKMVRENKMSTGMPIGRFIEDAILEKIERNKSGKSV